jgi:hypothetical protein
MNMKVFFVLLALSLMAGCSATLRLYPVQGPLSAQTPLPVFPGKFTGLVNSGNISFALGDGEVCKGLWTRVVPVKAAKGETIANPPSSGMSSVWDTVYGSGYYVSHVLGAKLYAQAAITGDRGTVLSVEFYRPNPGSERVHVFGVARDSKDNIYKLVFNTM